MPANVASFTVEDYDRETSTVTVSIGPLTAVNFDAKRAALDDLKAAIADIIGGEIRKTIFRIAVNPA